MRSNGDSNCGEVGELPIGLIPGVGNGGGRPPMIGGGGGGGPPPRVRGWRGPS
jgi:hypothetical protein